MTVSEMPRASSWKRKVDLTSQLSVSSAVSRTERQKPTSLGLVLNIDHRMPTLLSELFPDGTWVLLPFSPPGWDFRV